MVLFVFYIMFFMSLTPHPTVMQQNERLDDTDVGIGAVEYKMCSNCELKGGVGQVDQINFVR